MGGLYNVLNGTEPIAGALVAILNEAAPIDIPRFRDAHLNADGTEIIIRTRTGGGNRECYCEDYWKPEEDGPYEQGKHQPGCYPYMNDKMTKHPLYLKDEDDDFDCTYAYFHFKVPEKYLEKTKLLSSGEEPKGMAELTQAAIERIKSMTPEEIRADPKLGQVSKMFDKIAESLDKK